MTLKDLLPDWYTGVRELDVLMTAEDKNMKMIQMNIDKVKSNQWIQTADEQVISYHEWILNIIPNPTTESLVFRKQRIINRLQSTPPFTINYLTSHLNQFFGEGNYELRIDYTNYQIYLESAAENSNWFYESLIFIQKIKPANMEYYQVPTTTERISVIENATTQSLIFFRAGRSRAGDKVVEMSAEREVVLQ